MHGDPAVLSIAELGAAFRARQLLPIELTERCLARIAERDGSLHAFLTVTGELALEQARTATAELASGRDRGPLHGIPIGLKDLIDTAGIATTSGSAQFADRIPSEDAELVRRLRDAGAVIIGKLNLHEIAYGASGFVGFRPAARNPHDPAHICGGSSSGSAAAVVAGMCVAAIGSDTSGSIRIPAALCGLVGHKPSYGLTSLRGVMPLSLSYDHVGPMTRSVRDAAFVLQAIAGYDAADVTSAAFPPADYAAALTADRPRLKIGVPRTHFFEALDPEIASAVERALGIIAALPAPGAELRDITLPLDDDRTVFRTESHTFHRRWLAAAPERYQPETQRRLRTGGDTLAPDFLEKLQELQRMRRGAAALFDGIDLIVTPTVPIPAPSFAELEAAGDQLRARELVLMRNTRPFNIWGTPTLSIPCGTTRAGLPIGLQIAGPPGADAEVLRFGAMLEPALAG